MYINKFQKETKNIKTFQNTIKKISTKSKLNLNNALNQESKKFVVKVLKRS